MTVDFGTRHWRLRSHGFVCQTKKVNLRGYILLSLLASLFMHQSGKNLYYIVLEGWNRKNFHQLTFHKWNFSFLVDREHHYAFYLTWPIFGLPNAQECDHVSAPFWFDKQSHMTQIINIWRQNQLSQISLNLRPTCFGSILWILNLPQYSPLVVAVY